MIEQPISIRGLKKEPITAENVVNVTSTAERIKTHECILCEVCKHPLDYGVHMVYDVEDNLAGIRTKGRKCKISECGCEVTLAHFEFGPNMPDNMIRMILENEREKYLERKK